MQPYRFQGNFLTLRGAVLTASASVLTISSCGVAATCTVTPSGTCRFSVPFTPALDSARMSLEFQSSASFQAIACDGLELPVDWGNPYGANWNTAVWINGISWEALPPRPNTVTLYDSRFDGDSTVIRQDRLLPIPGGP